MQDKGLTSPRITREYLERQVRAEHYFTAANFDAEIGRKVARLDAINQLWPLEGYLLATRIEEHS
jgi:Phage protein (N4 Gp49/phage Sf6 gene 66) family